MDRTTMALARVDTTGLGLEIGPSYNPIAPKSAGFDVRTLDHATQAGLQEKYRQIGLDQDHLDRIEPVDFVWTGEPLPEAITTGERFAYILAAHVIEHTVDFIGFLNECTELLAPGGVISLVVPDKRYCFDKYRPLTSAGSVVEAHLEPRKFHGPAAFIDTHLYTVRRHGTDNTWDAARDDDLALVPCSWERVNTTVGYVLPNDVYIDIHRWVFTPASFELLVGDLNSLGYLDAEIDAITDTSAFEFFVTLRRRESAPGSGPDVASAERMALLERMQSEERAGRETALASELDDLYGSASWRLTAPLRSLAARGRLMAAARRERRHG